MRDEIIAFLIILLLTVAVCLIIKKDIKIEPVHEHVKTKQFITKYGTAPVVFCKTEYKILLHDGTLSDIVLPVILFPEMEEVE
ncbi:MAG: hypothetical protein ABJI69_13265 [Balneola sp.]